MQYKFEAQYPRGPFLPPNHFSHIEIHSEKTARIRKIQKAVAVSRVCSGVLKGIAKCYKFQDFGHREPWVDAVRTLSAPWGVF